MMTNEVLRIGTRGSRLARWQAEHVAGELRRHHPGLTVELIEIRTLGDRDRNSPLAAIGGAGVFTKEIQRALLDGSVDVAVHSLKDLPTAEIEGLTLGAVPDREAVFDGLIAPGHGSLDALPAGARVGTGSLRRRAMLKHARPDLEVVELRGNVETRLKQALEGPLDAVVLAEAGLRRLGLAGRIDEILGPPRFLPAVGQGALGLECRAGDSTAQGFLAALDDRAAHRAVLAERAMLAALHGGCLVPLGAWGRVEGDDGVVRLDAAVLDPDGSRRLEASGVGQDAAALGRELAARLLDLGAGELLAGIPR